MTRPARTSSRVAVQPRAHDSAERILEAAEQLMRARGKLDFTLAEFGKFGKIATGSMYHWFKGKDDIIHVLQLRVLDKVKEAQAAGAARSIAASNDLPTLVANLIETLAETLRESAPLLRPLMLRAVTDPALRGPGRRMYWTFARQIEQALLERRAEITHPDPDRGVAATFQIAYSALARSLGFGSEATFDQGGDWEELKQDLKLMCIGFLLIRPKLGAAVGGIHELAGP